MRSDLTYEQFKAFAEREPSLEGNWIYRLAHVRYGSIDSYPEFEVENEIYWYTSFGDAEKFIHEMVVHKVNNSDTYRFEIVQLPIGRLYGRGACWIYDRDGKLIDYSATITWDFDTEQSVFYGRPESRMRFKKGDIVEVVGNDRVNLAVVAADGPDIDRFWKMYDSSKNCKYGLHFADESDDCYYVIDGPGYAYHSHIRSIAMMKPSRPIPDDVREYFEHCLECADMEDCTDKYRSCTFFEDKISEYSTNSVHIEYDKDAKRHRLVRLAYDDTTETKTTSPFSQDEIESISRWLGDVMYGKTRLWYLIRNWNERCRMDDEASLALDTPLSELL